jgi:HK97 family phage major capsid protein
MNIAKLISKFLKSGYVALTADEKSLLKENVGLMTAEASKKFKDAEEAAAEDEGEDEDEDEDEGEGEDGEVDEKALREMIAKSATDEVTKKMGEISDMLVDKFFKGAKAQRSKFLATGKKEVDSSKNETRTFFKALLEGDKETLKAYKAKATTINETGDDAKGGYLIPEELRAEVLRLAQNQYGVARREMFYLPFTGPGNERKIPTLLTGVSVSWVNEKGKKPGTNPTFSLVTQTLKKLAAIIPFTEEILEDSAVNLTALVAQLFAEAVAKEEDIQFFTGTGTPWTGVLNNGSVNHVDMGAGEDITDITADDLLDMIDETPAGALTGAKFYLHRHALSVIRKLKDPVTGAYIFQRPTDGMPGTIWDFPYELVEAFPNKTEGLTHTKGIIAFGNLKLACILGDKQQIRAKLLDQATVTDGDGTTVLNLAEEDMIALRLEERVGYLLALPSAVTVLKTGTAS